MDTQEKIKYLIDLKCYRWPDDKVKALAEIDAIVPDYADHISGDMMSDIEAADYERCCLMLTAIANGFDERYNNWRFYVRPIIVRMIKLLEEEL